MYSVNKEANVTEKSCSSLSKDKFLSEYNDVFSGLGCMKGEVSLKLKDNAKPVVHPPRNVPIALRDKLKSELDRMESMNVIRRQTDPVDWVNSLVTVVKSNGDLRVCIDPRNLNEGICREHHPMNTIEKISPKLVGAKMFTVLDAKSGYWQMCLDEPSSKLCTFNTPYGRYRFLRAPFGISAIPEIFQARMSSLFENMDGVDIVMDDILVWGTSEVEHDARLKKVMEVIRCANLRLNKDKLKFKCSEVSYLGHILCQDGLKVDPGKVKAVVDMPKPVDVPSLQRFLGMVTYCAKFVPDLSTKTAGMRKLLEKGRVWSWDQDSELSYNETVGALSNAPVLAFYDASKPLVLSVDSSSTGLGAALLQDGYPVAYASRALTDCETRWAQIEKECLAILYGVKRFNDYVCHRPFVCESDHKPLESIFRKPLHQAPVRLQRMLMVLQPYDMTVSYKKGSQMFIADTLSRAYLPNNSETHVELETPVEVHLIKEQTALSPEKFDLFRDKSQSDPCLSLVMTLTNDGWPTEKVDCPAICLPYWTIKDELSVVDGVLFKGSKVVVPNSLRKEMLDKIHESHLGVVKCKARARDVLYWPGMSSQIEDVVAKCSVCNENRNRQSSEPLLNHDIPDGPWVKVASDLFEYRNCHYLLIVDYYSKFPEIYRLGNDTRAQAVVNAHKAIFSRHGICHTLVSDNGPQYRSHEFKEFARDWSFKHVTSSPLYPQSNGQVERYVQTVKNLIKKSDDPCYALLEYRTTPLEGVGYSPSQLLMGRRLNTKLPVSKVLLKPSLPDVSSVQRGIEANQVKQKSYFDAHTKSLDELVAGETVRVLKEGKWQPGVVVGKAETPRSYNVKLANGSELRRNRRVIRKTKESGDIVKDSFENNVDDVIVSKIPVPVSKQNVSLMPNAGTECTKQVPVTTRTGRVVTTPSRFKDYVKH